MAQASLHQPALLLEDLAAAVLVHGDEPAELVAGQERAGLRRSCDVFLPVVGFEDLRSTPDQNVTASAGTLGGR